MWKEVAVVEHEVYLSDVPQRPVNIATIIFSPHKQFPG
jgi:hypothetical protein